MKVGVVQFAAGFDKPANLVAVQRLVGAAADQGASLVIAPEAAMHDFGEQARPLAPVAEPLDGPFVNGLVETAKQRQVTVVAGMFESVADDPARAYNTVVAIGADGTLL